MYTFFGELQKHALLSAEQTLCDQGVADANQAIRTDNLSNCTNNGADQVEYGPDS